MFIRRPPILERGFVLSSLLSLSPLCMGELCEKILKAILKIIRAYHNTHNIYSVGKKKLNKIDYQ